MLKYYIRPERHTPDRPIEPGVPGKIGGPQWNNQIVIDEQLQVMKRNDRIIVRGWLIIIVEMVVATILGLTIYLMGK